MRKAFHLEFAVEAERDFGLIFDHLLRSYIEFGESLEGALDHAESRIAEIRATAGRVITAPHRGERHDDILPGLRHLAIGRAIYWFDVDDQQQTVRVLAVFFGGQDHVRHMIARLLEDSAESGWSP
ncbi:MAG: type II toxin-antitoxin system RelE/ParE family toxin [Gammaproteobacteria bacterium]|nr:type II toxin-antitoxin system RelE/ParE family toxin [Gammaproteobacteria bacterium]